MKTNKNSASLRFYKNAGLVGVLVAGMTYGAQALPYFYNENPAAIDQFSGPNLVGLTTYTVLNEAGIGWIWQAANGVDHATFRTKMYNMLTTGFNGGDWLGATGISSEWARLDAGVNGVLAVMMYDNTQIGFSSFQGKAGLDNVSGNTDFNQVMVRLTYTGDYNADGQISFLDFLALNSYASGPDVFNGDITFDGVVNNLDFLALNSVAMAYGNLGVPGFAGIVPEPASGLLLASGIGGLLGLRRRKSSARPQV